MPHTVALFLWLVLLLALFHYDPAKAPETSPALWVPVIWMSIVASRLPSQWLGLRIETATEALQEGNSLDRVILALLPPGPLSRSDETLFAPARSINL